MSKSGTRPVVDAEIRTAIGRKTNKLRREGKIPANVFGKNVKSVSLTIDRMKFSKLFRKVGETTLIDLSVKGDKETRPVLVSDIQRDPVTDLLIHVDFHQVDLTQKVTADIPVRIVGEAPAVKDKGAVLVPVLSSIEVEALPTDLPDHFEADITVLVELGDSIHVKDLKIDRMKVKLMVDDGETVVTVQAQKAEEEVKSAVPAAAEGAPAAEAGAAPAEPADAKAMAGKGEKKAEAPVAAGKPQEKKAPANEKK